MPNFITNNKVMAAITLAATTALLTITFIVARATIRRHRNAKTEIVSTGNLTESNSSKPGGNKEDRNDDDVKPKRKVVSSQPSVTATEVGHKGGATDENKKDLEDGSIPGSEKLEGGTMFGSVDAFPPLETTPIDPSASLIPSEVRAVETKEDQTVKKEPTIGEGGTKVVDGSGDVIGKGPIADADHVEDKGGTKEKIEE